MRSHRFEVNIPDDRRLSVELPTDFPTGPAEVIVLSDAAEERRVVRLGGALATNGPIPEGDPIADNLGEMRAERTKARAQESGQIRREDGLRWIVTGNDAEVRQQDEEGSPPVRVGNLVGFQGGWVRGEEPVRAGRVSRGRSRSDGGWGAAG